MEARKTQNEDTQLWYDGANLQSESKFAEALAKYNEVTNKLAKIHFNIGLIKLSLQKPEEAAQSFTQTTEKDAYMALGFFARGVANYEARRYPQALDDFERTLKLCRGSPMIDYTQLGMKFKLFKCDVFLDAGLACSKLHNGREHDFFRQAADPDMHVEERHVVYATGNLATVQLVGVSGTLPFAPPANHVAALKKKNWMKKSEVKAAWNGDQDTSWKGEELLRKKQLEEKKKEKSARPPPRPELTAEALKRLAAEQGLAPSQKQYTHIAKFDYDKSYDGDLELREGDFISLTLDNKDGWYTGFSKRLQHYGVFPATYVELLPKGGEIAKLSPLPAASGPAAKALGDPPVLTDLKKEVASAVARQAAGCVKQAPQVATKHHGSQVTKAAGSSPPSIKRPPPGRKAPLLSTSSPDFEGSVTGLKAKSTPTAFATTLPQKATVSQVSKLTPDSSRGESSAGLKMTRADARGLAVDAAGSISGVDRERILSVKERLAMQRRSGADGPSKAKVAIAFGQPKVAWNATVKEVARPAMLSLVDTVGKCTTGTVVPGKEIILKVRHKDIRRMRVQSDVSIEALEKCIADKLNLREEIDLWWADKGKPTRLVGTKLSYSFRNSDGVIFCTPHGQNLVL